MLAAWVSTEVEAKFLDAVASEDFQVVNLTSADFARMAELARDYDDLPPGTTDASVIALAERLGVREIATTHSRRRRRTVPRTRFRRSDRVFRPQPTVTVNTRNPPFSFRFNV